MRVALVEHDPKPEWRAGLDALAAGLAERPGWTVVRGGGDADVWLISAGDSQAFAPLLAGRDPVSLRRTVLLGAALGWDFYEWDHPAGSLPHLLESHQLGGVALPLALVSWCECPAPFAGRRDLMSQFQTNCMKSSQSRDYCIWGRAPGETLAAFLIAYLPALFT